MTIWCHINECKGVNLLNSKIIIIFGYRLAAYECFENVQKSIECRKLRKLKSIKEIERSFIHETKEWYTHRGGEREHSKTIRYKLEKSLMNINIKISDVKVIAMCVWFAKRQNSCHEIFMEILNDHQNKRNQRNN